jgi:hypothetical protein
LCRWTTRLEQISGAPWRETFDVPMPVSPAE